MCEAVADPALLLKLCLVASVLSRSVQIEKKWNFLPLFPPLPVAGCGVVCSAGVMRAGEGGAVLQVKAQQGFDCNTLFFPDTCSF